MRRKLIITKNGDRRWVPWVKAHNRIKLAMRENERRVLVHVKREVRENGAYKQHPGFYNRSWNNALDRLEAKGKIKYSRKVSGYILAKSS